MENKIEKQKYKLGLVLSGGGVRGFAHIGALQSMCELGLTPDIISGTSAGALAGVLFADGYTPAEIMALFKGVKFGKLATTAIPLDGFFKTTGLQTFLEKHLRAKTFEELRIPLRVVASDIEKGESVIFESGELIPAVVASCTFPIMFTPIKIGDRYLVDGGLFINLPVSVIRKECEKVIGVNVSFITTMPYSRSMKYVLGRSMHYLMASNVLADRQDCDYLIESEEISRFPLFELDKSEAIYRKGYEVAVDYLKENKKRLEQDFLSASMPSSKKDIGLFSALTKLFVASAKKKLKS